MSYRTQDTEPSMEDAGQLLRQAQRSRMCSYTGTCTAAVPLRPHLSGSSIRLTLFLRNQLTITLYLPVQTVQPLRTLHPPQQPARRDSPTLTHLQSLSSDMGHVFGSNLNL